LQRVSSIPLQHFPKETLFKKQAQSLPVGCQPGTPVILSYVPKRKSSPDIGISPFFCLVLTGTVKTDIMWITVVIPPIIQNPFLID
jgi:hypothetical protein